MHSKEPHMHSKRPHMHILRGGLSRSGIEIKDIDFKGRFEVGRVVATECQRHVRELVAPHLEKMERETLV